MYFPKTNKMFTSSQGIINHIKHNGDMLCRLDLMRLKRE